MLIARAPNRLSFLGGSSDYLSWYAGREGLVVGTAINQYSYFAVREISATQTPTTRFKLAYSSLEEVSSLDDIQHGIIRESLRLLEFTNEDRLEIHHFSDMPAGCGVGSSSTFTVGLLKALSCYRGRFLNNYELAKMASHLERDILGHTVGNQDQIFAAFGGLSTIRFHKDGTWTVSPLTLSRESIIHLHSHLMLFFTGSTRSSSDIASSYADRMGENSAKMWAIVKQAQDGIDALIRGDYERFGAIIDQAWQTKASLSPQVSTPEINRMYAEMRLAGAYGGKLMGAGGGGCFFVVTPIENRREIMEVAIHHGATHVPFSFDYAGASIVYNAG